MISERTSSLAISASSRPFVSNRLTGTDAFSIFFRCLVTGCPVPVFAKFSLKIALISVLFPTPVFPAIIMLGLTILL